MTLKLNFVKRVVHVSLLPTDVFHDCDKCTVQSVLMCATFVGILVGAQNLTFVHFQKLHLTELELHQLGLSI